MTDSKKTSRLKGDLIRRNQKPQLPEQPSRLKGDLIRRKDRTN